MKRRQDYKKSETGTNINHVKGLGGQTSINKNYDVHIKNSHSSDSFFYKFWVQRKFYFIPILLLFFVGFDILLVNVLMASDSFRPIDIQTGLVNFKHVFIMLFLLDFVVASIMGLPLWLCAYIRYVRSLNVVPQSYLLLFWIILFIFSYILWLFVIYNVLIIQVATVLLASMVLILGYLCYNIKHE